MDKVVRSISLATSALGLFCLFCSAPVAAQDMGLIDPATAARVLPAAEMSQDVFYDNATVAIPGWTRVKGDWQAVFTAADYTQAQIDQIASSGFYAALYKDANGNIMIAYRSTKELSEWTSTNIPATQGQIPDQYHYASQLAALVAANVKQTSPNATISVTGHSLGGALATYAAEQMLGISNVTTFNAPRPPLLSTVIHGGVSQINIVVRSDIVGDPKSSVAPYNFGYLPGKTYEVQSTTDQGQSILNRGTFQPESNDTHALQGIVGGLCNTSPSSSCPKTQTATVKP